MTEALMRHAYTIPHGDTVTSVPRAAAAIVLYHLQQEAA